MKFHAERTDVERSGVVSETTFRIKTTAKAFDILSSGLYTDPKLAIVRELSCNAYDAHTAAGHSDVPFEIHLPNNLEPWFHVRDFGTGLSDEDVMTLYTTYFDSTKTESNAFIGALGLGSKSPFSYTKAFEVISRFNGKRRIYSAFINEDGLPSIARLGEFDTDEINGLEVRIAIQREDFFAFVDRTAKALRWFPVKPTVSGYPNFTFEGLPEARLEGKNWKMFDTDFARDVSKMTAVQGNVGYKVDITKLGLSNTDMEMVRNVHIVGFYEIGDLEVAANREEIRYDDRSKAALLAKVAEVRAGVIASVEERVNAIKDEPFWNVVIALSIMAGEVFNDYRLFKEFIKSSTNPLIGRYLTLTNGYMGITHLRGHELSGFERTTGMKGITTRRKEIGNGITPDANLKIFYNDLPKGGIARAMDWVRQQPATKGIRRPPTAIVIRPHANFIETISDGDGKFSLYKWTEKDYVNEIKQLVKELGDVKLLLTSKDTPVPTRAKVVQKTDLPIFVLEGARGSRYTPRVGWSRTTNVDLNAGGIYFHLLNGAHVSYLDKKGEVCPLNWNAEYVETNLSTIASIINRHHNTNHDARSMYAMGAQAIAKIKKNPKWVNAFDVIREISKLYHDAAIFLNNLEATEDAYGLKTRCITAIEKADTGFIRGINKLPTSSVLKQKFLPLIEDHKKYNSYVPSIAFMQKLNVDLELGFNYNNTKPYFTDNDFKVYPMLTLTHNLEYQSGHDETSILFDYINMIDRS